MIIPRHDLDFQRHMSGSFCVEVRGDCSFCWCWWNCWPSKNKFYILVKQTTNVIYPLIQPACQQLWYIYCEFIYGKWNICFQAYSISLRIIVDVRVCRLFLYTTDQLMYPTMEADWWHTWSISDFIMYLFCGLAFQYFVSSFHSEILGNSHI